MATIPNSLAIPKKYKTSYDTPIPPEKQQEFNTWVAQQKAMGKDILADKEDYDVQGFFLDNVARNEAAKDPRGHGPDTYKKPNHPTFSDESIYHGVNGNYGGRWENQDGKDVFKAAPTNLKYRSKRELEDYFRKYEPETTLVMP